MTKYHQAWLLIFSQSGGWKSQIKVPSGLLSREAFLPGLQAAIFLLCLHKTFLLCGYPEGEREHVREIGF